MDNFIQYVRLSRFELAKAIFPLKQQVKVAFYAVIAVVTIVSLYLALIDLIMHFSIQKIIG
jgi:preprotein translocase subunit SecE